MLNRNDFSIFVPAAEFLAPKLKETNEMDISHRRKRERLKAFCQSQGVRYVRMNADCTYLQTWVEMETANAKMIIELKDPGVLITIKTEDKPQPQTEKTRKES